MNSLKVFSASFEGAIQPADALVLNGRIPTTNYDFLLRSITFDWCAGYMDGGEYVLPPASNVSQRLKLEIVGNPNTLPIIADTFEIDPPLNGTVVAQHNGQSLVFYTPGKRNFETFYYSGELAWRFFQDNLNSSVSFNYWFSIIIEIQTL